MYRISREMLSDALHSVNKRAKNYRDEKRRGVEGAEEKEREMYDKKEILLSLLDPVYIHREPIYETEQFVVDDPHFRDELLKAILDHSIIWWSSYRKNKRIHYFFLKKKDVKDYQYYLFYPFEDYSYHIPITKEELPEYDYLPIRDISNLVTTGADGLLEMEKVNEIIKHIEEEDYEFDEEITESDVEKHWNSKELSFEADRKVEEAYQYLHNYIEKGILMAPGNKELTSEDKNALYDKVYFGLLNKLSKCDTKEDMQKKAERFKVYFNTPVISQELIFNLPDEYNKKVKDAIWYWDKKGCFKEKQEYYCKLESAKKFCRRITKNITRKVIAELCGKEI